MATDEPPKLDHDEPYLYTTIEYPPRMMRRFGVANVHVEWVDGHGIRRVTGVEIDVGR